MVIAATLVDLACLFPLNKPEHRGRYEFAEMNQPGLAISSTASPGSSFRRTGSLVPRPGNAGADAKGNGEGLENLHIPESRKGQTGNDQQSDEHQVFRFAHMWRAVHRIRFVQSSPL